MPRLLFEKKGNAVWISHLDLMRVFQRAFRRAGMLLRHSQGYTPHAYVSILLPMSVGVSSQCEVLDYELDPGDTTPEAEIPAKLNACLPAGIRILASYESEKNWASCRPGWTWSMTAATPRPAGTPSPPCSSVPACF